VRSRPKELDRAIFMHGGARGRARYAASLTPVLRAVASAAGPDGRACLIETEGVVEQATTALAIVRALAEPRGASRLLARLLREMLHEANRDLGDGTARLALLWGELVVQGSRSLTAGTDPEQFATALQRLGARLSAALDQAELKSRSQVDTALIAAVAASAGASPDVADAIAKMLARLGNDGATEIVGSRQLGLRSEIGDGFLFDAAPVSEAFATADLDPAFVLVADERIDDLGPLLLLLDGFATRGKALVVVARDVSGPALHALVRNHNENGLRAVALRPAAVGQSAADSLEDLAIATGATLVADRFGTSLVRLRPGMLGRCARFSIGGGRAVFSEPSADPSAVEQRQALLLAEAERQKFLALDRERLQVRAARLGGVWARLHVGAATDRETRKQVDVARRALASARSALGGGVLRGGGAGLVQYFDSLPIDQAERSNPSAAAAAFAMASGLSTLVRRLAQDSAPVPVRARPGRLGEALGLNSGGNSEVLDPLPLTRSILERAVSGAVAFLRSGAAIHEQKVGTSRE
jgi:chaperonin GroEL